MISVRIVEFLSFTSECFYRFYSKKPLLQPLTHFRIIVHKLLSFFRILLPRTPRTIIAGISAIKNTLKRSEDKRYKIYRIKNTLRKLSREPTIITNKIIFCFTAIVGNNPRIVASNSDFLSSSIFE